MTNRERTRAWESIVDDLGPWAQAFGLRRDAQLAGTGRPSTDSPSFLSGDVSVYRADDLIYVHRRVGDLGEVVFMLRPRPGAAPELVRDLFMYGTPGADHSSN